MIINRPFYLDQLSLAKDKDIIKVITGIRRCGKSFLLFNLYRDFLLQQGIDAQHIILINLETIANKPYRNAEKLYAHILAKMTDGERYYIFLDEIQLVDDFEDLVNGLKADHNCDVYITGSNSKLLSKDINTKFRGRTLEIKVYPLSFQEFFTSQNEDKATAYNNYLLYGGLPFIADLNSVKQKRDYLSDISATVIFKDIVERHKIQNEEAFQAVFDFLCSSIGSPISPHKLANTLRSNGYKALSDETVSNYIIYLCDAFLFYKAQRFDLKGKQYLKTLGKYYVTDLGIRNARLEYRQLEITHALENLVYLELRRRGYSVDIGKNRDKEIDFVARMGENIYYLQVAYTINTPEKMEQEISSFRSLDDGYKKIIITNDQDPYSALANGYKKLYILDFLQDDAILEKI